jgi:bifunctional UDP-N-acetylglucosamine pyrophosphorylase/glucosamine-1-phosphate N-acetyltransferase
VAPVTIADGAYVGSGSVITENVPVDALALERSQQVIKEGWAKRYRAEKTAKRKPKAG